MPQYSSFSSPYVEKNMSTEPQLEKNCVSLLQHVQVVKIIKNI